VTSTHAGSSAITREVVENAYAAFAERDIPRLLGLLDADNASEEVLALEVLRILVDGDMAAVIGTTTVRARRTAITYTTDFVHLVTVGDGRVTRFQEFFDTHLAAAAFAAP
jgi:ketosteroid isomerase-like protein